MDFSSKKKKFYAQDDIPKTRRELFLLTRIMSLSKKYQDMLSLCENILNMVLEIFEFNGRGVYSVDFETNIAEIICSSGLPEAFITEINYINIHNSPYNQVFIQKKPLIAENYHELNPKRSEKWNILSIASIPLFTEKKVYGALNIASKKYFKFSKEIKLIFQNLGHEIGNIIEIFDFDFKFNKSESQLGSILENLSVPLHLIDKNYNIIYYNYSFKKLIKKFGFPVEIKGKSLFNLYPFLGNIRHEYDEVKKVGKKLITNEYRKIGDREGFFKITKIPVKKNNEVHQIITIIEDITVKVKSDQRLKESEDKYYQLYERSPSMICLVSLDGRIIDINNSLINHYGGDPKSLIGKHFRELDCYPPEMKIKLLELYSTLLKQGNIEPFEIKLFPLYKEIIWVFLEANLINLGDKQYIQVIMQDITNLKLAEEKLKKSEEKYRLITENTNDLIRVLNNNFIIGYINEPSHMRFLGYLEDDLVGKDALHLIHPDEYREIRRFMIKLKKNGEATREGRIRHKNNIWIWFEIRGQIFFNDDGELNYLFVSRDITDRKKAEQELKDSEEKFRTIAEQSHIGIAIIQKLKIQYANNRLSEILGYPISELLTWTKDTILSIVHPEDYEKIKLIFSEFSNSKRAYIEGLQFRVSRKDGNMIWLDISAKEINYLGSQGNLSLIMDITKNKLADDLLKESEGKYRLISEDSNDLISIINENLEIEYINEQTHIRKLGYDIDSLKDAAFRLKITHPNDQKAEARGIRKGFLRGSYSNTIRLMHANGYYLWFAVNGRMFRDKNGKKKILCESRDITEIKRVEKKLLQLNQLKSELIRRASHEFKTPLVSVLNAADLILKSSETLNSNTKKLLKIIKQGGNRLNTLVNNLLDVSKLELGKIVLEKVDINLIRLINNCVREVKFLAEERDIAITLDSTGDYTVNVDVLRFEQVIINLLYNSIKYTPIHGKIDISIIKPQEKELIIKVKDNGIGFEKEEIENLFSKFGKIERYGIGENLITEGTGLGLYICKEIIDLHKGKIWVESEGRNKGSVFIISLPFSN
ncbi:MAG: PAS domain S-box protein [Promethearchaeota archaeon]